jgi:hypothetical protein
MSQSQITTPDAAFRLARTIASDILLYNKDKIAEGIKNDTLFDVLRDEIHEGRGLYESRVSPDIREKYNLLDRALVDVLVKASANLPTNIW